MSDAPPGPDVEVGPELVARPRPGLATVEIEGEAVVYDAELETTHLLSPTGALVWGLLDGETSLAELSGELAEAFGAAPEEVLSDVITLAEDLHRRGLLEIAAPGSVPGNGSTNGGSRPGG